MPATASKPRCVYCRATVDVPDTYQHGDHIKCGQCGTQHKVARGEVLRLVLADATPLKEALATNQALIERLEAEIRDARHSLGIGANGFGIGVAYLLYYLAFQDEAFSTGLVLRAVVTAVVSGLILELANFLFLAKRQKIARLTGELEDAKADGRSLQQKIREAGKV